MREEIENDAEVKDEKRSLTSNLVNDPELTANFQTTALRIAQGLKHKYYQVFEFTEPEDIVSDCWKKILSEDISYDKSRGASFNTFVRMMIECRILDIVRKASTASRAYISIISFDKVIEYEKNNTQETVASIIPDTNAEVSFRVSELIEELKTYSDWFTENIPEFKKYVNLYAQGYSTNEISDMMGISAWKVNSYRCVIRHLYKNRSTGDAKTLAEVMYYESQEWDIDKSKEDNKRYNYLIDLSYMMTDKETGIRLFDIVKFVLKGLSYSKISEKLKTKYPEVNEYTIKHVLKKYEGILI